VSAPAHDRDVVVVGGGIIGRAVAWQLAERGVDVELLDPDPSRAAAHVAAGMLAPVSEATPEEGPLAALGLASAERWPDFVRGLEAAAGQAIDHRAHGTLHVAVDADAAAELDELARRLDAMGLETQRLSATECRDHEPLLAPGVRGGLFAPSDHVVDPRAVMAALALAGQRAGIVETRAAVTELAGDGIVLEDGSRRTARRIVVAAGAWSGAFGLPVHPVRGETLHLAARDGHEGLGGNVRGIVAGRSVYLAARRGGRAVVGSTMEELGFDTRARVGAVRQLLADARALVPAIDEYELVEIAVGLRPASPDNGPLIGHWSPGVIAATGHFRNGILLTPITVDAVVAMVTGDPVPPSVTPFDPHRFEPAR